jgi:hypothetical protein
MGGLITSSLGAGGYYPSSWLALCGLPCPWRDDWLHPVQIILRTVLHRPCIVGWPNYNQSLVRQLVTVSDFTVYC